MVDAVDSILCGVVCVICDGERNTRHASAQTRPFFYRSTVKKEMAGGSAALAIGLNYTGTESQLNGCINDANAMAQHYTSHGLVAPADVRVLVEPTGFMIVEALRALARRSHVDSLERVYISYSGHGSQVRDDNGDEADGRDECICPKDYATKGMITDDQIKALLSEFNPATLVCFLCDACHSASMADLPVVYTSSIGIATPNCSPVPARVILISGCLDAQTSADAFDAETRSFSGAMTNALLGVLTRCPGADVFKVVVEMRKLLRQRGFTQKPLLSASFNIPHGTPFL
jgi:hypothetical protein